MKTNEEIINRLIRYRNVLQKMKGLGFARVFSDNLADAVGVSPSLVRKDFSMFELTGNKRGGYQLQTLLDRLSQLLGKDKKQNIIVVGCGKIGRALMNYNGFPRVGIRVVAGFDSEPALLSPDAPIPILHVRKMKQYIADNDIKVAVLTVPEPSAQSILDSLMKANIRGVVNFAPITLKGSESCFIHNINIEQEFEKLFYRIQFAEQQ
ncbi:redox-sensing transcriptional repressor Rex [Tichowtungia aerotolerans]|uniref:Redox-sensing transcriptional repressor Rex n=1 Tax=Tichowtungia aerotolerans TaxID=2697043 RepID=A0A6P1MBH2_9BACT|nr:redox-sensing transcriptional repressor Rex [Tichowtungia aerotolerans]QHI69894.1 redox-sensing transcriptional repressor Rex [Tichowtungia aerotolerans]